MIKPRVLIVDTFYYGVGGGQILSLWMAQALIHECSVDLCSWVELDLADLDRLAGTALATSDVKAITPPRWLFRLGEWIDRLEGKAYGIQRWAVYHRYLQWFSRSYDVVVSSMNEMDFGQPGIQYVHYPEKAEHSRRGVTGEMLWRKRSPWQFLANFRWYSVLRNLTVTNSYWTADVIRSAYGVEAEVVYPPVPGAFKALAWDERDLSVICVGRIAEDKRLPWVVETVRRVREIVPGLRLRIVGVRGRLEELRMLDGWVSQFDWIDVHLNVDRSELLDLIRRSRIGLHAKFEEHFGIAVAEMVLGGCAVLVHNSGGAVEIVGGDPRLLYRDIDEAVARCVALLTDHEMRADVLSGLRDSHSRFGVDRFKSQILELVKTAL